VIGHGRSVVSRSRLPFGAKLDFRNWVAETDKGLHAMNQAKSALSLKCRPEDARRALYLLTAPPGQMSMDLITDLSSSLRSIATDAIIRSGDYPRGKDSLDITLILSELTNSARISDYFSKTLRYIYQRKRKRGKFGDQQAGLEEALRDIPLLL